jgi:predicted flap endonuclease-1-like 5' DNA nuclease
MAAASQAGSDMGYATRSATDAATDMVGDVGEAVGDAAEGVAGMAAAGVDAVQSGVEEVVEAVDEAFTGNVSVYDMDEMAKFKNPLEFVEGIGSIYADKLRAIGIANCLDLIKRGATPKGRADIAAQSGISARQILTWVNHVDLYRIKGVGSEYADLLEASGVDTVVELAQRNPATLYTKINALNVEQQRVRRPPTQTQVEDWVAQAKGLPRVITY